MSDPTLASERYRRGPVVAVVVVAVSLAVGQAIGWLVLRATGLSGTSQGGLIVSSLAAFIPTLAVIGAWVTVWEKRSFASLGFVGDRRARKVLLGALLAVLFLLLLNLVTSVLGDNSTADSGGRQSVNLAGALLLLVAVAVQSSTEEVLFRGYLLPRFRNRWGVAAGVLGSSLLFACAHLANPNAPMAYVLMTFFLGIALSLWALADGAIWRTCAFHSIWNFVPDLLASGEDSPTLEGRTVAASVLALMVVVGCAAWSYRRSVQRPTIRALEGETP